MDSFVRMRGRETGRPVCPVVLAGLFLTHVTVSDTPAHAVVDVPVPALDGHARRLDVKPRGSDPSRIVPVGDSIGVHVRPDTPVRIR